MQKATPHAPLLQPDFELMQRFPFHIVRQLFAIAVFILPCIFPTVLLGQDTPAKPKLVVGIVIDQMRHEYLYRYATHYGQGGFNRLIAGGFSCNNTHFNYVPTNTAPGHASIYTGTTPSVHGIIGNGWYNKATGGVKYCAGDSSVHSVGTPNPAHRMSPRPMLCNSIADELRLITLKRSKTVGISLKDRGAILPAGHLASWAFWFDGPTGNWVTSSYYGKVLPGWAAQFNEGGLSAHYASLVWNASRPMGALQESIADSNGFEAPFIGERSPAFPHNIPELAPYNGGYEILKSTPFGNSITTAFAISAINGERLGTDDYTDMLAISYSAADAIGHRFAPDSKEVEDAFVRLDSEIERLLNHLDQTVGEGNYLVFLTADHGSISNPNYLRSMGAPGGSFSSIGTTGALRQHLETVFGPGDWMLNMVGENVYFNHPLLYRKKVNVRELEEATVAFLMQIPGIANAVSARDLMTGHFPAGPLQLLQAGYNQQRSGDVLFLLQPGYLEFTGLGSSHGSAYNYDTHVPLIWYGAGIKPGQTAERHSIIDIAPTLSRLLDIPLPSAATGNPITKVLGE